MNTLTPQSILDKIKKEEIKPKAKWRLAFEHTLLWIPGVVVTTIGAIAVAGTLYSLSHSGWEYREFTHDSLFTFIIDAFPLLWLLSFVLFSSLIVQALRTTHAGYKLSLKRILFGSIIVSIIIGWGIYIADDTYKADSFIRFSVHEREKVLWDMPSEGRLVGIVEAVEPSYVTMRDEEGELWNVTMPSLSTTTFPFIVIGDPIRVIGTTTEENTFTACLVFPWEIGGVHPPLPVLKNIKKYSPIKMTPDCKVILETLKHFPRERK